MKCEVLGIREVKGGMRIAHIQVGQMFGDAPVDRQFVMEAQAELRPHLRIRNGRFEAVLRVENHEP